MNITIEERNIMTIINIERIVVESLKYVDNPKNPNFSQQERSSFLQILTNLTSVGSPFEVNCTNNGEFGSKLKEDMAYFIEDVFSDDGRIVRKDLNDKVIVEESLVKELYGTICNLRLRLEIIVEAGIKLLKDNKKLDKEVEELVSLDNKFFHSVAAKIGSKILITTFDELNQASRIYYESYSRSHGGIDPHSDKNFNPSDDANIRMLENEFKQINQDLVNVINLYKEADNQFLSAKENLYEDFQIFSGKKKTTNFQSFTNLFVSYFDKIVAGVSPLLDNAYNIVGSELQKFDEEMMKKIQKEKESNTTKEE